MIRLVRGVGLLAERNFRLLWFGETISQLGTAVTTVAMPLLAVLALDASTFVVGLLNAAVWLPWVLVGLPAGAVVDRLPSRLVMILADAISVLLLLSVPVAAHFGLLTVPLLLAVAFGVGVAAVFLLTAYQVLLPSLVEAEHLPEANSKLLGSEAAARIVGPGLGGVLTQLVGAVTGLVVNAAGFLVSLVCLSTIRVREEAGRRVERGGSLLRDVAVGVRHVVVDPYLRPLTLYAAVSNLAAAALQALQVVFLVRAVGVGSAEVGLVLALAGSGAVLGALAVRRFTARTGTARGLLLIALCTAPFALLMPLSTGGVGLLWFVVGGFVLDAGIAAVNVIIGSFRQRYCPREVLGRVTASMRTVSNGALPLGALLGGALGTFLDLRAAMWVAAASQLVCVVFLLTRHLRRLRDLPVAA
ncbi:MFS transporter [Saccharothrix australiensis]|uniref:Putative MFS family arabinose efflux permease n=1 Tax=Saccharothrix australiensis TaxID=2072 RepID=A0A495VXV2_9PSEU|nr:MFS transporter [Saccharothrix australiensis]RKT54242.1 putative MFS family arabinose efflux permease [Saccharothrix australiensis]